VFFSYALITKTSVKLYIEPGKLTQSVREHLGNEVEIGPYDAIFDDLKNLRTSLKEDKQV